MPFSSPNNSLLCQMKKRWQMPRCKIPDPTALATAPSQDSLQAGGNGDQAQLLHRLGAIVPSTSLRGILAWRLGTMLRAVFNDVEVSSRECSAKLNGYDNDDRSSQIGFMKRKRGNRLKRGVLTKGSKVGLSFKGTWNPGKGKKSRWARPADVVSLVATSNESRALYGQAG